MSKRILMLNASALKQSSCDERVRLQVVEGYRKALNTNDIEFGSSFHACAKHTALNNGNIGIGIQEAFIYFDKHPSILKSKKAYLDKNYLYKVCTTWHTDSFLTDSFNYVEDESGRPIVEVRFVLPFYSTSDTDVLLCGTIDKIVRHRTSKALAIGDYKTTSMWDEKEYLKSYDMSCQLNFYTMCLYKWIDRAAEGTILKSLGGEQIYSFIDGVFLRGADNPIKIIRSDLRKVPKSKLEEFESMLLDYVAQFVFDLEHNKIRKTGILNDSCTTKYGLCEFFDVCNANDETATYHVLKNNFVIKPYNPLTFGE